MIDYIESAMKAPQGPVIEGKLPANGSTIEEVIYISNCQLVEMGWMGGGDNEEGDCCAGNQRSRPTERGKQSAAGVSLSLKTQQTNRAPSDWWPRG